VRCFCSSDVDDGGGQVDETHCTLSHSGGHAETRCRFDKERDVYQLALEQVRARLYDFVVVCEVSVKHLPVADLGPDTLRYDPVRKVGVVEEVGGLLILAPGAGDYAIAVNPHDLVARLLHGAQYV